MRFDYCPFCGTKCVEREIGDEGMVPWCEKCAKPLFDMFSTCVIVLVVNEFDQSVILRQSYISNQYGNLISGYMKPGETAEDCARREVLEETGIAVEDLNLAGTWWFAKKDMLMIGLIARARKADFKLSGEVDQAAWISVEQAIHEVHPKGSISYALVEKYLTGK